jgi:DNA-directed DNA polymerase III PolC
MPVSLHTHSWYSLLEGVASPQALLERARELGCTTLALTDTNNLYGAVAFVEEAFRRDIRPLLGARLRLGRQRCVALIAERAGYRNLCRILSRLHLEGGDDPDSSPTLLDLLQAHPDGLHILVEDIALAEGLREALGRRLWLEIVRPRAGGGRQEQELLDCGQRLGVKAVASTAAHFASPAEYPILRLLTAIRQRTLLDRLPAALPLMPEHSLVAPEELCRRFRDQPALVANTDSLADLLRSDVLPRDLILPEPHTPHSRAGRTPSISDLTEYLRRLCERGLNQRDMGFNPEARQRLRDELTIIESAQLSGYFLTVRDIARHARRRGHSMALRGSAGNSLVCYLLGITDVDPLRFNLPLERFLHAGRPDLPDIDLDFDWKVRDEVIAHVVKRYGAAHTAQISTHLFFQPRSAFREAGRIHGLSNEQISALLTTLARSVDDLLLSPDALPPCPSSFPLEPERWPRLLADARLVLGRPHHLSIHPGGVVITPGPIADYVPLERAAKGVVVTQFEKDAVESVGLVKIDLLGNRGLSTVDEARRLANAPLTADSAPDADPATLALLCRGDTLGVTQLESPAMRHLLIQMQPRCLDDVIQSLALLRPGAAGIGMKESYIRRRHGLEPVRLLHPRLVALLDDTHGLMIYEDDTLRLVQALTGLSAVDADRFRKRIAKHASEEEAQQLRADFLALCTKQGVPPEAVAEVWLQLAKFNRYSFCKSHAVSYGLIAWQAAWLKAHHPTAFWTAALNNAQGAYPRRVYIEAIKRAGIEIRPPCVNRSELTFSREDNAPASNRLVQAPSARDRPGFDHGGCHAFAAFLDMVNPPGSVGRESMGPMQQQDSSSGARRGSLSGRHAFAASLSPDTDQSMEGRESMAPSDLPKLDDLASEGEGSPSGAIRIGLGVIVGLPLEVQGELIKQRRREGPYASLADLRRRVRPGPEALALLIRAGALDFTGRSRPALFLDAELQDRQDAVVDGLFPDHRPFEWTPADYSVEHRLLEQWRLLGFVLGPSLFSLFRVRGPERRGGPSLISSRELPAHRGRMVRLRGLVATARYTFTNDDRPLQFVSLEDEYGLAEVTLFPGTCPQIPHLTIGPYEAVGMVEEQYGVFTITARSFEWCQPTGEVVD